MAAPYSEKVMDHFMHPRNVGEIENPDGIGHVGNPVCVVPDTLICKNEEIVAIKTLKKGDKVLSHDGKYHEVIRIYERLYEGEIYYIKVESGEQTVVTPEHHILAMKKGIIDWYAAQELEKEDMILYPANSIESRQNALGYSQKTWLDSNYYLLPIEEIEAKNYKGSLFNLDVDRTHSYLSNALILHNCGDIMEMYIKVKDNIIVDAKFKTFGCIPAGEEIVTTDGGWKMVEGISRGDEVINEAGIETKVVETHVRDYSGTLLTITPFVSPFNAFSVTSEHPVLVLKRDWVKRSRYTNKWCKWKQVRDEEELWKTPLHYAKVKDLFDGDYLVFCVNKKVEDNPIYTKEVMRLLGYYLSEGYSSAQGSVVAFAFNRNETENIKEVKSLLKKIVEKDAKERIRGNVSEVYICSRKLCRFLSSLAGCYAREKLLTKEIMVLPFNKQWEMVSTYLKGDGNSYRRRKKDSETYRITTTSRNLVIQMQEILARGGIFASIREIYKRNCVIEGRKLKDSKMYLISYKLSRKHRFVHCSSKYFLVPIKNIKKESFEGKVYNFQVVGEPNSYLIKGFAVHNCGAAIATSSMVTEMVKGKTIEEALKISNQTVAEALGGLPPIKMHCSVLAEDALKGAIDDYLKKTTGKGLEGWKPRWDEHIAQGTDGLHS